MQHIRLWKLPEPIHAVTGDESDAFVEWVHSKYPAATVAYDPNGEPTLDWLRITADGQEEVACGGLIVFRDGWFENLGSAQGHVHYPLEWASALRDSPVILEEE